jgi:hydrogenase large subunit
VTRLAIDPVTRVGGHLRVEVEVTNGVVSDAWSSATMFRGIESILNGRDPREAWLLAQRVCGSCSGVHALASVRAVERALGATIPPNARSIRNLLLGSEFVLGHIIHFYNEAILDWIDPKAALSADPAATAVFASRFRLVPGPETDRYRAARDRLSAFVGAGGSGPFIDDGPGGAAMRAQPEAALMVMADYLDALDIQRRILRLQVLLGGKSPHPQSFLVGGAAVPVPWGGPPPTLPGQHPLQVDQRSPSALSVDGLDAMESVVTDAQDFVAQVYIPDVLAICTSYPGWVGLGAGKGNYLSYGEFPLDDSATPGLLLPRGRIVDGVLTQVMAIDQIDIGESVARSHYTYGDDDTVLRHPFDGRTDPRYGGPPVPFTSLEGADRYSWLKAPRYREVAMETGPLARILVANTQGQRAVQERIDEVVGRLGLGPGVLTGTLGRMLARAIEAQVVADQLEVSVGELKATLAAGDLAVVDLSRWAPETWPASAQGWSLGEGPRGAVGHWVTIADGRIAAYQIVDASTWNASPRDARGQRGPMEEALVGIPMAEPARPVEILRTVHSFAPCTSCGVQ